MSNSRCYSLVSGNTHVRDEDNAARQYVGGSEPRGEEHGLEGELDSRGSQTTTM